MRLKEENIILDVGCWPCLKYEYWTSRRIVAVSGDIAMICNIQLVGIYCQDRAEAPLWIQDAECVAVTALGIHTEISYGQVVFPSTHTACG